MTTEEYSETLKVKKAKLSTKDLGELEKENGADFISSQPITVQNGIDTAF